MDTVQLESEFQIQVDQVKLDLGDHLRFEFNSTDGKWTQLTNPGNSKSKSSTANQKLEAENNWLKIQADLLLNMVITMMKLWRSEKFYWLKIYNSF